MNFRVILLYIFMSFLWGTTWPASKLGVEVLPPFFFSGTRFTIGIFFLAAVLLFRKTSFRLNREEFKSLFFLGCVLFAVPFGLVTWGVKFTSGGMAAVILATNPIFIFIIAALRKEAEEFTLLKVLGTLLGLGGAALIFLPELYAHNLQSLKGDGLVLFTSLIFAFGILYARRHTKDIPSDKATFYQTLFAVPVLFLMGLLFEDRHLFLQNLSLPQAWGSTLFLAFFGSTLAFILFYWFIKKYGATVAASAIYPEIAFALLLDWIIFDHVPTLYGWCGIALILAGVWLVTRKQQRPSHDEALNPALPET